MKHSTLAPVLHPGDNVIAATVQPAVVSEKATPRFKWNAVRSGS
jgi:hypothetical protein